MVRPSKFTLEFAPETIDHLAAIERKYHNLIAKTIDEPLRFAPDRETRNRKPLERSTTFGATWELRFGANNRFRVFYEIDAMEKSVRILAVGEKLGSQLFIGGKKVQI